MCRDRAGDVAKPSLRVQQVGCADEARVRNNAVRAEIETFLRAVKGRARRTPDARALQ